MRSVPCAAVGASPRTSPECFFDLRCGGVTTRPPVWRPGPWWPASARTSIAGPSARSLISSNWRAWVVSAQLAGRAGLHHSTRPSPSVATMDLTAFCLFLPEMNLSRSTCATARSSARAGVTLNCWARVVRDRLVSRRGVSGREDTQGPAGLAWACGAGRRCQRVGPWSCFGTRGPDHPGRPAQRPGDVVETTGGVPHAGNRTCALRPVAQWGEYEMRGGGSAAHATGG